MEMCVLFDVSNLYRSHAEKLLVERFGFLRPGSPWNIHRDCSATRGADISGN